MVNVLTDSKFWIGVIAGIVLYFAYTRYASKGMKG